MIAAAQNTIDDRVAFTTPDAPWTVWLDGKNLDLENRQQIKSDNKSGYFMMFDEADGMTASLFIEPVDKCKTSEECRDFVLKTGNPKWGKVENLVKSKIGDVSYFEFFRPTVQNQPLQVQDMYAEFVQDGYWVDLHISKVEYKKEDRVLFENLVKSVKFISKNDKSPMISDKAIDAARKTAESWTILLDAGKYKESYAALTADTKEVFAEKTWTDERAATLKTFGKLKSRKLVQLQTIKTLPDNVGSGAIFWYLSSYENQPQVTESVSVIFEQNAAWKVANYNIFE